MGLAVLRGGEVVQQGAATGAALDGDRRRLSHRHSRLQLSPTCANVRSATVVLPEIALAKHAAWIQVRPHLARLSRCTHPYGTIGGVGNRGAVCRGEQRARASRPRTGRTAQPGSASQAPAGRDGAAAGVECRLLAAGCGCRQTCADVRGAAHIFPLATGAIVHLAVVSRCARVRSAVGRALNWSAYCDEEQRGARHQARCREPG